MRTIDVGGNQGRGNPPARYTFAPGAIEGPEGDTREFHQENTPGSLLASPAFWLCGAICALCWVPLLVAIWKH